MASCLVMNAVQLPVQVAMHDDELPVSFVNRVAAANGFRSVSEFCEITGLNLGRLAHGSEYEVNSLAEWTGVSPDRLRTFAFKQGHIFAFGHAVLKTRGFHRAGFRFCPLCCAEETNGGAPVIRATWQWRPISCCPLHEMPLLSSSCNVGETGSPSAMVIETTNNAQRPTSPKAIALSKYLTDQILRLADEDFIGKLPLYVTLEFFDVLGSLDRRIRYRPCLRTGRFELAAAGYQIAKLGTDAICELLSRRMAGIDWSTATGLRVDIYAEVKSWLWRHKNNADYVAIADLFRPYARSHPRPATGEVFARKVGSRRIHTVQSASAEYCVPAALVRKLLKDYGVPLPSNDLLSEFKFSATIADELFGGPGIPLDLHEAAQALECLPATITELVDLQLLKSVSRNDKSNQETLVSSATLSGLLKSLYQGADPTPMAPGLRSLPHCAVASGVSEARIVGFLLAGRLRTIAISKACPGLGALRLSLREVLSLKRHGN